MKSIFIAGTDTDSGKTHVTGLLLRYMLDRGMGAVSQKWVQTGSSFSSPDSDIQRHLIYLKKCETEKMSPHEKLRCPYFYKFPASPHLSAKLENKKTDIKVIKQSYFTLSKLFDFVIVEGTGGLLVPLNSRYTILDVAEALKIPVLLVVNNKLGAVNHALLSIAELKRRNIFIVGAVMNHTGSGQTEIEKNNPLIIKKISGVKILGTLEFSKGRVYPQKFDAIGSAILKALNEKIRK